MNKELFKFYGVTKEDYLKWCKQVKLPHYRNETLKIFIFKLKSGEITKESINNGNK